MWIKQGIRSSGSNLSTLSAGVVFSTIALLLVVVSPSSLVGKRNTHYPPIVLVEAVGQGTDTWTLTFSGTYTETITPADTATGTDTFTLTATDSLELTNSETVEMTMSDTVSQSPQQCSVDYNTIPITLTASSFVDVAEAPPSLQADTLSVFEIPATTFALEGATVEVVLKHAIFDYTREPKDLLTYIAKDRLAYPFFGPPKSWPVGGESDYDSQEHHGLRVAMYEKRQLKVRVSMSSLRTLSIQFLATPSYRISEDEYIYLSFYENSTVPPGCATPSPSNPAVIRIKAFQYSTTYQITQVICFMCLIFGIVAACAGNSVTISHQAGMVAIVAAQHFAQEDGNLMGLGVHPTQFRVGDTKYKYVLGGILGGAGCVGFILLVQQLALLKFRLSGYAPTEAHRITRWPRISIAVIVHFSPTLMYCLARNFGNQRTIMFVLTSTVFGFLIALLSWGFKMHISSSTSFPAKWKPHRLQTDDPLRDGHFHKVQLSKKQHLSILGRTIPAVMTGFRGCWVPVDQTKSFVITHGFVFENYVHKARYWMGMEIIDFFLSTLLNVFDNYTRVLALYQYLITLIIKVIIMLTLIIKKPCANRHSGLLLLIVYFSQIIAELSLFVGSLRHPLMAISQPFQDYACLIGAGCCLADCCLVALRSVIQFRERLNRPRDYDVEKTEGFAPETHEGYLLDSKETPLLVLGKMPQKDEYGNWKRKRGKDGKQKFILEGEVSESEDGEDEDYDSEAEMAEIAKEREAQLMERMLGSAAPSDTKGKENKIIKDERSEEPESPPEAQAGVEENRDSDEDSDEGTRLRFVRERTPSDCSAYDDDGRPVLSHPRHLEVEPDGEVPYGSPTYGFPDTLNNSTGGGLKSKEEEADGEEWVEEEEVDENDLSLSRSKSPGSMSPGSNAGSQKKKKKPKPTADIRNFVKRQKDREWKALRAAGRYQMWTEIADATAGVRPTNALCEEDYLVL